MFQEQESQWTKETLFMLHHNPLKVSKSTITNIRKQTQQRLSSKGQWILILPQMVAIIFSSFRLPANFEYTQKKEVPATLTSWHCASSGGAFNIHTTLSTHQEVSNIHRRGQQHSEVSCGFYPRLHITIYWPHLPALRPNRGIWRYLQVSLGHCIHRVSNRGSKMVHGECPVQLVKKENMSAGKVFNDVMWVFESFIGILITMPTFTDMVVLWNFSKEQ